jgi:hypothetical protein
MSANILEPTSGRKRIIITFKPKAKREKKDVDKTLLV